MVIEWETLEYEHREKPNNWYWMVGFLSVAFVIGTIVMKNFLLAILIILGAFTLVLYARRPPRVIHIAVNRRGIQIHKSLFPFHTLRSFWIHDEEDGARKIIIQSEKLLMPHIHLPLNDDLDHEALRTFLLDFLPEVPHRPTIVDLLAEYL
ncbi:MAG TPA: hypothetical protein VJB69_00055 [Candidatus Paceibacterota bacterium]